MPVPTPVVYFLRLYAFIGDIFMPLDRLGEPFEHIRTVPTKIALLVPWSMSVFFRGWSLVSAVIMPADGLLEFFEWVDAVVPRPVLMALGILAWIMIPVLLVATFLQLRIMRRDARLLAAAGHGAIVESEKGFH
jgi:hypothetical protein